MWKMYFSISTDDLLGKFFRGLGLWTPVLAGHRSHPPLIAIVYWVLSSFTPCPVSLKSATAISYNGNHHCKIVVIIFSYMRVHKMQTVETRYLLWTKHIILNAEAEMWNHLGQGIDIFKKIAAQWNQLGVYSDSLKLFYQVWVCFEIHENFKLDKFWKIWNSEKTFQGPILFEVSWKYQEIFEMPEPI